MAPVTSSAGIALTPVTGVTRRQLHIRGLRIHTEIHGEGEPLLMHSGLWAEAGLWNPLLPYLPGFQVIAFDPPGVGRSDAPAVPLTIRGLASLGAEVLDRLGIDSAHVLGTSFGGAVAQQMAMCYPSRVRRLVLVSTSYGGLLSRPGDPLALWHFMQPHTFQPGRLEQVAGDMFGGRLRAEPELIRSMHIRRPPSLRAAMYRMAPIFCWTSLPWLWAIRQPTLIVCGDDDPITPHVNQVVMAALMPRARLHTVRGGGHLVLLDSPGQTGPVITEFLGGRAGAWREPGDASPVFQPAA